MKAREVLQLADRLGERRQRVVVGHIKAREVLQLADRLGERVDPTGGRSRRDGLVPLHRMAHLPRARVSVAHLFRALMGMRTIFLFDVSLADSDAASRRESRHDAQHQVGGHIRGREVLQLADRLGERRQIGC